MLINGWNGNRRWWINPERVAWVWTPLVSSGSVKEKIWDHNIQQVWITRMQNTSRKMFEAGNVEPTSDRDSKVHKRVLSGDSRTSATPISLSSAVPLPQWVRVYASPSAPALSAGARIHGHAGVNLQHHVPAGIQEENAEGAHLLRDAARLRDAGNDAHGSDDALDGGVIGGADHLGKTGGGRGKKRQGTFVSF